MAVETGSTKLLGIDTRKGKFSTPKIFHAYA